jgi:flagellar biosynthetic protein FlhB
VSDEDNEKTEDASEKKLGELRKEGKVAQSHDLLSAATLVAVCATLGATAQDIAQKLQGLTIRIFRLGDVHDLGQAIDASVSTLASLLPAIAAAFVAAIVAGLAQTRGIFSIELVFPKLERLDPLGKLKQLLPGKEMAIEMGKSLLKILTIAVVVKKLLQDSMGRLMMLGTADARVSASEVAGIAVSLMLWGGGTFAVVAAIDYFVALRKFQTDSKMSKQDLKEEFKQEEQDPGLKRKMRMRARELMKQASAGGVETATVLVTNPTHFAVALRYDPEKDAAPMVVGKAVDEAALAMRGKARKRSIPIVENRPLARALHKNAKVGKPVPVEMYRAVAEVIAHVMRLRAGGRS